MTDPLYAPGNDQGKYWRAALRCVRAGYAVKRVRLEGTDLEKAEQCRALQENMMAWYEAHGRIHRNTWRWLFSRYKRDDFSPFAEVKANTRAAYEEAIGKLDDAIGTERLADWNMIRVKTWHRDMINEGRSIDYTHRLWRQMKQCISYGVTIENRECTRLAPILSNIRFPAPKPRTSILTRPQALAIIEEADRAGYASFGTALLLLFETGLRPGDVRGHWLSDTKGGGGITDGKMRWADGLTWDMIDQDCTSLRRSTSKTNTPVEFCLTDMPVVRARLKAIPRTAGPVFVTRRGLPYRERHFEVLFAKFRDAAGLPADLQLRDMRAGAITEAKAAGAAPADIRDYAGHSDIQTTNRYMRGRADGASRVVKLRQEKAK